MRILLVEDDTLLGDGVRSALGISGHTVDWLTDGREAEAALRSEQFDAVVLDLGLPRMSGLDLLRVLRARGDTTPVLVLTARDTVADRIHGLDSGADDYLVKPFDLDELAARLRAIVRRQDGRAAPLLRHGNLELDPAAREVRVEERAVDLSPREYAMLEQLLRHRGRVLTRAQLEENLYGWGGEIDSNAVEVHVHHLRRKLGAELIRTVRGVGYLIPNRPA